MRSSRDHACVIIRLRPTSTAYCAASIRRRTLCCVPDWECNGRDRQIPSTLCSLMACAIFDSDKSRPTAFRSPKEQRSSSHPRNDLLINGRNSKESFLARPTGNMGVPCVQPAGTTTSLMHNHRTCGKRTTGRYESVTARWRNGRCFVPFDLPPLLKSNNWSGSPPPILYYPMVRHSHSIVPGGFDVTS